MVESRQQDVHRARCVWVFRRRGDCSELKSSWRWYTVSHPIPPFHAQVITDPKHRDVRPGLVILYEIKTVNQYENTIYKRVDIRVCMTDHNIVNQLHAKKKKKGCESMATNSCPILPKPDSALQFGLGLTGSFQRGLIREECHCII